MQTAIKASNPAWAALSRAIDEPDEKARTAQYITLLVCQFPVEEWGGAEWRPVTITPEDIDNGLLDERDLDALENIVLHIWTAEEATAMATGGDVEVSGIAGWSDFRGQPGGDSDSPDGGGMAPAPVKPISRRRSGRGVCAGRSIGVPDGERKTAGRKTTRKQPAS
jgi:hypothetical protein